MESAFSSYAYRHRVFAEESGTSSRDRFNCWDTS